MMRSGNRKNRFRSKAERPLLLLFPGCCDDATASAMRIRKLRGLPGNAAGSDQRENSTSSAAALADESHLLPLAENFIPDDAPSSRSPALQDRPYMNLDEFVSSLAQKNCFPDEDTHHKTGESSSSRINFFDDQSVDTCLRLAINPDPVRIKGGHLIDDGGLQPSSTARIESPSEAGKITVPGESHQTTSIPEPEEEVEGEDGQPEQTPPKSSTESKERRPRRTTRSTGRKTEWSAGEEEEEEDDDESSERSTQRNKTRKRKRKKSERSSVTQDHTSSEKKAKTGKQKKPGSSSRSGRPKKLKYMKQENTEELGNQCNRSDGKGWTCPLLAKTGYQLCDHHLDKLRCKPGSRSKYNKSKKKKQQGAAASTLS